MGKGLDGKCNVMSKEVLANIEIQGFGICKCVDLLSFYIGLGLGLPCLRPVSVLLTEKLAGSLSHRLFLKWW